MQNDLADLEKGIPISNFSVAERDLAMEFRVIERISLHQDHANNLQIIRLQQFQGENRHPTVLPFRHSQVKLGKMPVAKIAHNDLMIKKHVSESKDIAVSYPYFTKHNKTENSQILEGLLLKTPEKQSESSEKSDEMELKQYINANFINGLVRGSSEKSIIACQAPLEKTITKFWQMIWDNDVSLIVMVCPLQGPKKEEATCYWGDESLILKHNDRPVFEVRLKSFEKCDSLIKRKFILSLIGGQNEHRFIDHVQEVGWPDDTGECEDMGKLVDILLKHREEHTTPMVVHCSAGIGRTGTLIAIYNLIESLRYTLEHEASLLET